MVAIAFVSRIAKRNLTPSKPAPRYVSLCDVRQAVLSFSSSSSFSFLELGGGFDLPDRGTAKNRNLNVNRDQRSKSEVENDDEGRGRLGKEASKKTPGFAAKRTPLHCAQ
jgi:hypothetical protein